MSNTNYDGRTLDLCILGDLPYAENTRSEVNSTLDISKGGQICAGVVKLTQKVMVLLLTYAHRYDSEWGTSLPEVAMSGTIDKAAERLAQVLPETMQRVVGLLKSEEFIDTPLDERIRQLDQYGETVIDYETGTLNVGFALSTLNGVTNTIIIPLRTNV